MHDLLLNEEVFQIIGAAMDVYYQLGRGFPEPIYQEAFEIELGRRGIPCERQSEAKVYYKGQELTKHYVPDVICFGQVIIELKVCDRLTGIEASQIMTYLKATRMHVGLLINFGSRGTLEWKRYVR
ncbi:MAG TPA: GxxExxY protein [Pyrinomonadaceae bacterium]|nr:GxxExxY protein [Pyrinomonadaceae bacterium]